MLNLKKITMTLAILAFTSPLLITDAFANKNYGGGFTGNRPDLVTVEEAKKMPDNSYATLRGNIVRYNGDEKYLFRDASGEQIIEIDNDIWRGQQISADDLVEILVEIDKDWGIAEFEAEEISIVQK